MSYVEQTHVGGTKLTASALNHMEKGISEAHEELGKKVSSSGHTPNQFLGTDEKGNVVTKSAPDGSSDSGENATSLTLTSPNGIKWAVTVSDDGTLAAAKLGGTVEPEEPDTGGNATENITQTGSTLRIVSTVVEPVQTGSTLRIT